MGPGTRTTLYYFYSLFLKELILPQTTIHLRIPQPESGPRLGLKVVLAAVLPVPPGDHGGEDCQVVGDALPGAVELFNDGGGAFHGHDLGE